MISDTPQRTNKRLNDAAAESGEYELVLINDAAAVDELHRDLLWLYDQCMARKVTDGAKWFVAATVVE